MPGLVHGGGEVTGVLRHGRRWHSSQCVMASSMVTEEQTTVVKHSGSTSASVRSAADVREDHDGDRSSAVSSGCLRGSGR